MAGGKVVCKTIVVLLDQSTVMEWYILAYVSWQVWNKPSLLSL